MGYPTYMPFQVRNMKRWIVRTSLVLLALLIVMLIGALIVANRLGLIVDWESVLRMQPPFFIEQYRVVRIEFENRSIFENEISKLGPHYGIDIWEIGDNYMVGKVTDPVVEKLRKREFKVVILYESVEDYIKSIEGEPETKNP